MCVTIWHYPICLMLTLLFHINQIWFLWSVLTCSQTGISTNKKALDVNLSEGWMCIPRISSEMQETCWEAAPCLSVMRISSQLGELWMWCQLLNITLICTDNVASLAVNINIHQPFCFFLWWGSLTFSQPLKKYN